MPLPLLIPAAYEALVALGAGITAVAALFAAREGGKKLAQAIHNAQAEADGDAPTKTVPLDSTLKCKDCRPDPNCGKWLDQAKRNWKTASTAASFQKTFKKTSTT